MMDQAITFNTLLGILGILVAIVAGVGAIATLIKYITDAHDRRQKWDDYDKQIAEVKAIIEEKNTTLQTSMDDVKNVAYTTFDNKIDTLSESIDNRIDALQFKIDKLSEGVSKSHDYAYGEICDVKSDTDAKFQEIRAEQSIIIESLFGILEGQQQQGLNGGCKKAYEKLNGYMIQMAHGVEQ